MTAPSDAERIAWLRLARTPNVGPVAFDHLLRRFGSAKAALDALPRLTQRGAVPRPPPETAAVAEIEAGERLGARLLLAGEADFPTSLRTLDTPPPPLIWTLGDLALLSRPAVAVVGARVASAAGQRFARGLAADLGREGLVVASGLARGVDGAAHEGALATGTVAVLGGGVADIYPPEHEDLHGRIAAGGLIVSESPPRHRAQAKDFPRRNRLISGLALAVVVVEAELKSGSLITARLAAEQGREVLAVPGSPLDPRARGTNDLLRQGAAVCEGIEDVLRVLEGLNGRGVREPERGGWSPAAGEPDEALRERVAGLLSPTAAFVDDIVRGAGAPAPMVFAALVELALAGRAAFGPSGTVHRP
ncbi:DNA-processing protein DprA [Caulobacter mirabilis]|uniref:DNA-protecting protein DprA n=1 Tax=Caulobacter mirabilis TaxID=69666 RepID=A0A2D2AXC1_9CAUL|nr:DNA-processing protein DprA [Caulobacter mirabilis]ATQ42670.1 DNA-protecting protein DprA [Caulobacter mirabilis]